MGIEKGLAVFVKEQIKIEREIQESLEKSLVEIINPAVKGTLKSISLDSEKHAEMYSAIIDLFTYDEITQETYRKKLQERNPSEGLFKDKEGKDKVRQFICNFLDFLNHPEVQFKERVWRTNE